MPRVRLSRRTFLSRSSGRLAAALAGTTWVGRRINAAEPPDKAPPELHVSGIEQPELASFDRLMRRFMHRQQAVGAALAVTKDGRLVYARGFGLADREREQPVQPADLFRIASVSKPLSAVAVLKLVEQGKLKLDARVAPLLKLGKTKDPRWHEVTLLQLLHHTGGWDRDKSFDPMFRSVEIAQHFKQAPPAMPPAIIRYMAQESLDFDPGQRYAYSNFGYCLLGRVIEHASGQSYQEFVRREVLAPLGVRRSQLGATLLARRAPREVRYYDRDHRTAPAVMGPVGEKVPLPYGTWCLEAMDSHGGWLASAPDLVKFASAFDHPRHSPLLSAASIERMFARPAGPAGHDAQGKPLDSFYGCGWSVRPVGGHGQHNTWHNGALDGTSTLLVRRADGLNWAALFNRREGTGNEDLSALIDGPLHEAADAVKTWPTGDQFERFL